MTNPPPSYLETLAPYALGAPLPHGFGPPRHGLTVYMLRRLLVLHWPSLPPPVSWTREQWEAWLDTEGWRRVNAGRGPGAHTWLPSRRVPGYPDE